MIQTKTVRVDSVRKALSAHHMQKNFRLEIRFPESYNAKNAAQGAPKELRDPKGTVWNCVVTQSGIYRSPRLCSVLAWRLVYDFETGTRQITRNAPRLEIL